MRLVRAAAIPFMVTTLLYCLLALGADTSAQQLELVHEIGSAEGGSDYTFFRIGDIQVSATGEIFVLDRGDKTLRVYDASGRFRVRIGREGSGPGEFLAPTHLSLGAHDIEIVDGRLLRSSRFDYSGRHIETTPLAIPGGTQASRIFRLRDGSILIQTIYRAAVGSPDHDPFVHIVHVATNPTRRDTLATYEPAIIIWYVPGQKAPWGGVTTHHGDSGVLAVSGDSLIALINGAQGTAAVRRVYRQGLSRASTFQLGVRGQPFPHRLLAAIQDSVRAARRNRSITVAGPAQLSPITGQAFFAPDGELWIELVTEERAARQWLRIAPTSGAMRRIEVPRAFAARTTRDDLIYGVWRDAFDVETVRVYRIVER